MLLHVSSSDEPLLGAREDAPLVHFIFQLESCARCLCVYKVSGGASASLPPHPATLSLRKFYGVSPVHAFKVRVDKLLKIGSCLSDKKKRTSMLFNKYTLRKDAFLCLGKIKKNCFITGINTENHVSSLKEVSQDQIIQLPVLLC